MTFKLLCFGYIVLNILLLCRADIDFGYPEASEENINKQNILHKKPVYIPNHCKQDELLYPGDQSDDWVCDCKPGYLYYPPTNVCYAAYRQGPCRLNHYLILPKNSPIPVCAPSPCSDGEVLYMKRCYKLFQPGPCRLPELGTVVAVDPTTLEIDCLRELKIATPAPTPSQLSTDLGSRVGLDDDDDNVGDTSGSSTVNTVSTTTHRVRVPPPGIDSSLIGEDRCDIGSKRYIEEKCPDNKTVNRN